VSTGLQSADPRLTDPPDDGERTVVGAVDGARALVPPGTLLAGRYLVAQRLGSGASGDVHAAIDLDDRRVVAVKLAGAVEGTTRARLEREARLGKLLGDRPGIVRCLDSGLTAEGRTFLVHDLVEDAVPLDLLDGTLDERLGRLEAAVERVVEVHAAGVIHRDLKPANFLRDKAGKVHLLDFGLAKQRGEAEPDDGMLTQQGESIGTPAYMPIEQFENAKDADARSDVYALGVMLFVALTGHMPYEGGPLRVLTELIRDVHSARGAPRPSEVASGIPGPLDALCAAAMQLQPGRRLESAALFLDHLRGARAALAGAPPPVIERRSTTRAEPDEESLDRTIGVDRTAPLVRQGLDATRKHAALPAGGEALVDRTTNYDQTVAPGAPAAPKASRLLEGAVGGTVPIVDRTGASTDWRVVEPLGRGAMGEAWLVRRDADAAEAALKVSLAATDLGLEIERRIIEQLDHPNLVGFVGTGPRGSVAVERAYPNPLLLLDSVTPPGGGRTSRYPPLPPSVGLELAYDLLRGVAYLHSQSFVHHDIKVANFLVVPVTPLGSPTPGVVLDALGKSRLRGVLIDLGGARSFEWLEDVAAGKDAGDTVLPQLTPVLAPPEALIPRPTARGLQTHLHPSHDVYAAALTIYMMLTGHVPYDHVSAQVHSFPVLLELKRREQAGDISPISRAVIESIPLDDVRFVSADLRAPTLFADALWRLLDECTGPLERRPSASSLCARFAEAFELRGGPKDPRPRQGVFTMDFSTNRLALAAATAAALGGS
jgi:serine/threonine protein kinase